jgi:hypothetical protein
MYPSLTVPLFIYMPVLTRRGWGGRSGYWFCLCFDDLPNEFSNCSNDEVIIACLFFVVFFSFYYQHYILNNQFNPTTFDWSACTKQGKWPVVYLFARVSILSLSTYFYLGPSKIHSVNRRNRGKINTLNVPPNPAGSVQAYR